MDKYRKKPILIIIEGPAGVGKTTMQDFLHNSLSLKSIAVNTLPEFSNNRLGKLIEEHSCYGYDKPNWLIGINGLLLFLADKINVLEIAQMDREKIWLCDRFIPTQFVLGLQAIRSKEDSLFAKETIQRIFDWSLKKISEQSVFVFLDGNVDVLQSRLEKRIGRKLNQQELNNLEYEINGYRKLANSIETNNIFVVDANHSINNVGNKISKLIYSVWQQ